MAVIASTILVAQGMTTKTTAQGMTTNATGVDEGKCLGLFLMMVEGSTKCITSSSTHFSDPFGNEYAGYSVRYACAREGDWILYRRKNYSIAGETFGVKEKDDTCVDTLSNNNTKLIASVKRLGESKGLPQLKQQ
ncbi:MAG: hypothetical protein ACJAVV_003867 [Alphaproteobacteria bacterium]|jgi:hypothetical protein